MKGVNRLATNQRISESANTADLPRGWVWTTIGEITQPIEKVDLSQKPDAEFTYLDISSIDNITHVIREPKVYYGAEAPSRARQRVHGGDVLFSTVRTYLKNIAEVPQAYDDQIASTGFSVLRGKRGIAPKYLFYYSLTSGFLSALAELQRGTSYPAVRDSDVRDQPIPLAPTAEQHRIVAEIEKLFTRLDAGVAALKRAQAELKRYKAAVLKTACEGRLVPQDPNDEPASELLKRVLAERRAGWEAGLRAKGKDPKKAKYVEPKEPDVAELPELPKGWGWASAEQCTSVITDGEHITPERADSGILLLSARNIQDGFLSLDEVDYIPEHVYESLSKRLAIEPGDVLMSCSGSVGRSCVAPENLLFALVRSVAVLKPLSKMGWFLSLAIRSPFLQQQINEKKTQTAQANIFQNKIRRLIFPLPPLVEQRRIVAEVERRLSVAQELEATLAASLARAGRLRQSILKRAFEGRLVSQDPSDEPASVLLERIRGQRDQAGMLRGTVADGPPRLEA